MATATAMYHTGVNPLRGVRRNASDRVESVKGLRQRRLHKAFLRYHDPENWPVLREALKAMGRSDLIGPGKHELVPATQPAGTGVEREPQGRRFPTKVVFTRPKRACALPLHREARTDRNALVGAVAGDVRLGGEAELARALEHRRRVEHRGHELAIAVGQIPLVGDAAHLARVAV